jgi:hypothetical protein
MAVDGKGKITMQNQPLLKIYLFLQVFFGSGIPTSIHSRSSSNSEK